MLNNIRKHIYLIICSIVVLLSRLPFIQHGYGVEEDSWGIALAAFNTHTTGILEVSRFPGHPFQEILYSLLWGIGPLGFNLLSALFSVLAFLYLYFILKEYKVSLPLLGALSFSFIPVIFISSTYTIDYMWTCAFVLMSYYYILKNKIIAAGIFLGFAIACRITSGAMLLPLFIILWQTDKTTFVKNAVTLSILSIGIGILFFVPVYLVYGSDFFMYYDQFPYPPITKVLYKYSIGAFGLLGLISIAYSKGIVFYKKWIAREAISHNIPASHLIAWVIIFVLYTISYFRLPQKSGYVIPIIPFIVMGMSAFLSRKHFIVACAGLILSSFFFSINLTDKIRGAESTDAAIKFTVSGQEIFIDPFSGPVLSDLSKRKLKMNFTQKIIDTTTTLQNKTAIIAGWWYNEIMVELIDKNKNPNVSFEPYIDKSRIENYLYNGYSIYYLPEQNLYNDQMFGLNYTDSIAKPFIGD